MVREKDLNKMYINLASHFAPKTIISESVRALRTNVLFAGESEKVRTIAVTSSYPGEGKSMVSVNLAISLAQTGLKTLLVGVDFRSPAIGDFFSIEDGPGLTEVLLGNCPWEDTLKTVTDMVMGKMTMDDLMLTPGLDNLNIITTGSIPANPTELFNSDRFIEFIDTVKQEYDIIIFDSAPVLTTADTAILGVKVDAILIVYQPGMASKETLKRTSKQLRQVKSKILGVVLNGVKPDLIPDALRKKYSEHHSADTGSVKQEKGVEKVKKNTPLSKALILLAVIILLTSGILWKMGIIFPRKKSAPIAEVKKSEGPSTIAEPVKKDMSPEKKESAEKSDNTNTAETNQEETPVSAAEEIKTENKERIGAQEEIKPQYKEGSYPYVVHLASFKTMERAEKAIDEYAEKGFDSYPVKLDFGQKGVWYRIYSGYYPDTVSARVFIRENKLKDAEIKKTSYACYIDSFTDNENLEFAMSLLKEKKYFPYVITDHVGNAHFLFAGAFITQSAAKEFSEKLQADGFKNSVVAR